MKNAKSKHNRDNKRFRVFLIAIPLTILFLFCGATLVNQNADISRMQKQKQDLTSQLEKQKDSNEQLQEVVESDNKEDYIEQKAREKGYVKSNEIVFYDISGNE